MKKWLSMLLTVAMVFSCCAFASAEEEAKLTMWIWDNNQKPGTQAMADGFMAENPNISIEVYCTSDYTTKLPTVLGTDDCPDIMWLWGTATVDFISSGMLVDLQEYIDRDGYDTTGWVESITEWYTRDGDLYAIPKDFDGYCVFCNKAMFEAAGVEIPQNDWTWDDFAAVAQALSSDGIYGYTGTTSHRVFSAVSLSFGGKYYTEDGLTCLINDENTVKAWDFIKGMQDAGASGTYEDQVELGSTAMFTSGIAAMTIDGSWMISSYYDAIGDDLVCVEMPTGAAGKKVSTHGIGYAMSSTCKYPEQAWSFLKYLGTAEAQELLSDTVIPANIEASASWSANYAIDVSAVVAGLEYAVMYPMSSKNATAANSIEEKYINNFVAGNFSSAKECLDACCAEMQAAIDG